MFEIHRSYQAFTVEERCPVKEYVSCIFPQKFLCTILHPSGHHIPERSKKERGREGPGLAFLAGAHTDIWLGNEVGCKSTYKYN
jgi:hypothetical protein